MPVGRNRPGHEGSTANGARHPSRAEGSASLDPSSFIDTSSWASNFDLDHETNDDNVAVIHSTPDPQRRSRADGVVVSSADEIESLQQMLARG